MTPSQTRSQILNVLKRIVALAGLSLLTLASQASGETTPPTTAPPPPIKLSALSLAGIPQHDETLGSPTAPLKMLYFDDPQCPFCREWHTKVMPALVRKYVRTGKLQIQWHGFPVIGPASVTGERFIAAAGLQNHLWEMLDDIMANQGAENSGWLTTSLLEQIGASIPGLDLAQAIADAESQPITDELDADIRQGNEAHLEGVPFIELGRRGGPLRRLEPSSLTPGAFERPINHMLHKR
jgi:protein-disulfide isomerase